MRSFARISLTALLVTLAGGPLLAAPLSLTRTPTLAAAADDASPRSVLVKVLVYGAVAVGATRIKDTGSLAKKFVQRAQGAQKDYADGVAQAGGDWETNTKAAEDSFAQGVQAAIADKRFGKGVAAAGGGKYVDRATKLGAGRYPQGVAAAEGAWAQGAQPYLQALASMSLPLRGPKGDPRNQQRANAVAAALRMLKLGK